MAWWIAPVWVMELKHNHALAVELHTGMALFHHHTIMLFLVYQKQLAIHRLTVDQATPHTHTHTHTHTHKGMDKCMEESNPSG